MRKLSLYLLITFFSFESFGQNKKYTTTSGELIFSFAQYKVNGTEISTPVRFTCFFHFGAFKHYDFKKNIGVYSGLAIRNVGFTSSKGDSLIKRRNYYLGIPIGLKIGNLKENKYFYTGLESDFAFNYKEKLFIDGKRVDRFNIWFSERTNTILPSAFVGFNFKSGLNIKFKYYLRDFYNKDYQVLGNRPYENTSSKMFYFSLSMNVKDKFIKNRSKVYNKGI